MTAASPSTWGRRTPALGMLCFVLSDALSFAALFVARLTRGDEAAELGGPSGHVAVGLTVALAGVSAAMVLAVWAARHGRRRVGRVALGVAGLAGAGFAAGQLAELADLGHGGFVLGGSAEASWFFAITGLHGLHVVAGVVATAIVAGSKPGGPARVATLALYWHFVDLVWLAIALGLYR